MELNYRKGICYVGNYIVVISFRTRAQVEYRQVAHHWRQGVTKPIGMLKSMYTSFVQLRAYVTTGVLYGQT